MLNYKRLLDLALRKLGVTTHNKVFPFQVTDDEFVEINQRKRCILVVEHNQALRLGDLIRLAEYCPHRKRITGRETYYYVRHILTEVDGLMAGYCVLTLE